MTDATASDRQHVADLVSRAKVALLTTMTQKGTHVSRPMGLQEAGLDGDLFFACDDSVRAAHIRANRNDTVEL